MIDVRQQAGQHGRRDNMPPVPLGQHRGQFSVFSKSQLPDRVEGIRIFRNNFVAHGKEDAFVDQEAAEKEIKNWATGIAAIHKAMGKREELRGVPA